MDKRARSEQLEDRAPAFFVVGYSRSGTTLFSNLLSAHSQIAIPPETRFCHGVLPSGRPNFDVRSHAQIEDRVFAYWRIPDLGVEREEFRQAFAQREATYANAFACLLECYRRHGGKQLIGEKSPVHLLYIPMLRRWFPDAHIFVLIRDGRDVVNSMVHAPFSHNNRLRHAAEWRWQASFAAKMRAEHAEHVTIVRFEDLVTNTEAVMKGVCGHLELEMEATQLRPAADSPVVPEWEMDWKGQALDEIDEQKVAVWKNEETTSPNFRTSYQIMATELERWGYEVPELVSGFVARLTAWCFGGWRFGIDRWVEKEARILLHLSGLRKHL